MVTAIDITGNRDLSSTFHAIIRVLAEKIQVERESIWLLTNYLQQRDQVLEECIEAVKNGEVVTLPDLYYNTRYISPLLPDNPIWVRPVLFPMSENKNNYARFVFVKESITGRHRGLQRDMNRGEKTGEV